MDLSSGVGDLHILVYMLLQIPVAPPRPQVWGASSHHPILDVSSLPG